jgi:hypothetical protein
MSLSLLGKPGRLLETIRAAFNWHYKAQECWKRANREYLNFFEETRILKTTMVHVKKYTFNN